MSRIVRTPRLKSAIGSRYNGAVSRTSARTIAVRSNTVLKRISPRFVIRLPFGPKAVSSVPVGQIQPHQTRPKTPVPRSTSREGRYGSAAAGPRVSRTISPSKGLIREKAESASVPKRSIFHTRKMFLCYMMSLFL